MPDFLLPEDETMPKLFRVAVVGCGALAQSAHLPNIRRNPRMELIATCDMDAATAEQCRAQFGARRAETDWRRVIDAGDIDLVVLATREDFRGEFIVPALDAGKPVYTEKPLAPHISDMAAIINATRRTGVPVCVGHNRRSSPAMIEFRRLLEAARVTQGYAPSVDRRQGKREPVPEECRMQFLMRVNDDARSWKPWVFHCPEGILFGEMVHFLDIALWCNRSHPVRAFAEGSPRGNFVMVLTFADGSITTFHHTFVGHFDYPKELFEATLNNVTIAMDQHVEVRQCGMTDQTPSRAFPCLSDWAGKPGMAGLLQCVEEERLRAEREKRQARMLLVDKGHYRHLDRFLDHLEGKGENPCGVETAVPVNRLALKFLQSVRSGLPVPVLPEDWHLPEGEG
jgi:predicted dehydrogenase